MKLRMRTFGGFAAGIKRPAVEVDAAALPAHEQAALAKLLDAVPAAAATHRPRPDEMSYEITVEDGSQVRSIRGADTSMSPEFASLLEFVQKRSGSPSR